MSIYFIKHQILCSSFFENEYKWFGLRPLANCGQNGAAPIATQFFASVFQLLLYDYQRACFTAPFQAADSAWGTSPSNLNLLTHFFISWIPSDGDRRINFESFAGAFDDVYQGVNAPNLVRHIVGYGRANLIK